MAEESVRYAVEVREPEDKGKPLLGWTRVVIISSLSRANIIAGEIGAVRDCRIMRVAQTEIFNTEVQRDTQPESSPAGGLSDPAE